MNLLLATLSHETNTFSPVPSSYERFHSGHSDVLRGEAAITARAGTRTIGGGFIAAARRFGATLDYSLIAQASPSGIVPDAVFDAFCDIIVADIKKKHYNGVLLHLHGAMVVESYEDAEGEILRRIRKQYPVGIVGVALDMHGNIYPEMVSRADVICGYHTYPHVDQFETGERCASLVCRTILREISPKLYWGRRPMMPHIMRQGTHQNPNALLQQRCAELEQSGEVLAASVFTGFPHADIALAGLSAVVCADANSEVARLHAEKLLDCAWEKRSGFQYHPKPLSEVLAAVFESGRRNGRAGKPDILLDHCDNTGSGGTMDTTVLLAALIQSGIENAAFYAIYDPVAVNLAIAAGVGSRIAISIGGNTSLASVGDANPPLLIDGVVEHLSDGKFVKHGPMGGGVRVHTGPSAVIRVAGISVAIVSSHVEPSDINYLRSLHIHPEKLHYLALKSRVHWRAGLSGICGDVFECDSIGVTTSDYDKLNFLKVTRPVFPLDNI